MSPEQQPQEEIEIDGGLHEGADAHRDLVELFASADEGFPPIPAEKVVDDFEELLRDTNLSPEALEAYRIAHDVD